MDLLLFLSNFTAGEGCQLCFFGTCLATLCCYSFLPTYKGTPGLALSLDNHGASRVKDFEMAATLAVGLVQVTHACRPWLT